MAVPWLLVSDAVSAFCLGRHLRALGARRLLVKAAGVVIEGALLAGMALWTALLA